MNKNVIFIIFGALVVSILVALIVQSSLKKDDGAAAIDMAEILVAKKRIAVGQRLKAEDAEWQKWPKEAIYKGTIERSKQEDEEKLAVYDKIVRRSIEKGQPVSTHAIIKQSQAHNFLAASLGEDMRAFSVPVSAASSVGGFVRPGDRVDVLVTFRPRFSGATRDIAALAVERYATQTILQNVRVLAVDQRAKEAEDDSKKKIKPGKTVTLEVDRKGAEELALAVELGELSLALRKLGEKEITPESKTLTTDKSVADIYKLVKSIESRSRVSTGTVRLYNGRQVENVIVRQQ